MENTVNERVKMLRSYLKLTQSEFGAKIGAALPTISNMERGTSKPHQSTLVTICRVFNVNKEWLFEGKGEMFLPGENDSQKETNWKDEAFSTQKQYISTLEKEVEWLRGLVTKLTGSVNFPNGIDTAGMFLNPVNSVRAVA